MTDLSLKRLDIADTRAFTQPGAGLARRAALAEHAHTWLGQLWREACQGRRYDGVALAAVGSLARREAGPLSDYDLVLLHHPRGLSGAAVSEFADRIWYPIWDSGVRLDHSVRTVNECRGVAARDLPAATGLLDIAHVAGDPDVTNAVRATVLHDWRANARTRLPEVLDAVRARHARSGDLAQLLDPDLKEARGGLRDVTVMSALTAAWLTDRPHSETIDRAHGLILDVRDAVHVVTGRGRDRLVRDDHDACAALLGYGDADDLLTDVSMAAREIAFATDGMVRRAAQAQQARRLRVGPRRPTMTPLGHGLYLHDGEVVLGPSVAASSDPLLALRAALLAARNSTQLSPTTLRNLATSAPPLPTPWPQLARDLFADLLATGPALVPVWEGLDLVGLVEQWIPEWAAVRSRPQRSAVHRHSVDRHLVETVVTASAMVTDVARPDLLLLAALLHDIGKVHGAQDHSFTGAETAERILERMGWPDADRAVVVSLVREHLTLVELATRRDPQDPATLACLRTAVDGSVAQLDLLRALTEADAVAAGPLAWSDWRAQLVRQLYERTRASMSAAPPGVPASGQDAEAVTTVDALGLAPAVLERLAVGQPTVHVRSVGGAHEVQIVAADRAGLFADSAGVLAAHDLVVRAALVRTVERVAVNSWWVDTPHAEAPRAADIERDLARVAAGDRTPLARLARRRAAHSGRPAGSVAPVTRAMVLSGASQTATVIEVRAADRPGLLQDIGMTLARASLSVRSAHIATYAGQTLDTFYLTEYGGAVLSPARAAQAVAMVIETCDG